MTRVREAYREWAERFDAVGLLLGTLGPKLNEVFEERRREAFEAGYAAALPQLRSELVARLAADKEIRFTMAERILRHCEDAARSLGGE